MRRPDLIVAAATDATRAQEMRGAPRSILDAREDDLLGGIRFQRTRIDPALTPLRDLAARMAAAFGYTAELTVDPRLAELLRIRVAQLDPCAYCLILHNRVAHRMGIAPDLIAALPSWRESDLFSVGEKAALRYCEDLTVYDLAGFARTHEALRRHFDDRQIAEIAAVVINMAVWTRLKLAEGAVPSHEIRRGGQDDEMAASDAG